MARLAELTVYHVRIPLRVTVRHASHSRSETDNLVVCCRLDDGTMGFGEGVPRPYVTGETISSSLDLLRQTDWSPWREPVEGMAGAVRQARQLRLPVLPDDKRGIFGNAARCAVELAWLDAWGRRFGKRLDRLAEELPEYRSLWEPAERCRYSAVLTSGSAWSEANTAIKFWFARFKQIKVKVGTEGQDDPRRLKWFRRVLGPTRDLRVDANEAFGPGDAARKIRDLEPFGISSVEQPLRDEDCEELPALRKEIKTPIMLDESLCSPIDAERAISRGYCDLFNIRLSKCGGLLASFELAAMARKAGLGYQLGCQVGETGILSAAGRRFACSVGQIRYLEGSFDRYLVRERLTREDLTFGWKGLARALAGPGLGIEVNPQALGRVTVSKEQLYAA